MWLYSVGLYHWCCCRLTHDVTLDNISAADDTDTQGLVYECKKQSVQQRQTAPSDTLLLDKLQSRIETRNQRNSAYRSMVTSTNSHGEKADNETSPTDRKQKTDLRLTAGVYHSPRIEDVAADTGLNALSGDRRRQQSADSTVLCRNVEFTSRLDEIRQRFRSDQVIILNI